MVAMAAPVDMAKHTVNMPGKMTKKPLTYVLQPFYASLLGLFKLSTLVILDLTIQIYKNNFVDVV